METYKLCIILFLIFVVIHLLDNNNVEFLTQTESRELANNNVKVFDNKTAINTQNNEVNKNVPLDGLVAPEGITYTSDAVNYNANQASDFKNEMSKMGISKNDNEPINYYDKQMQDNLSTKSFNAKDFLPQEINEDWFNTDLTKAQNEIDQSTLIDISKFCQGVDTVGQSLKNPSYDIRGNIPNPKIAVSPWQNSSYEPDTNLRSWC